MTSTPPRRLRVLIASDAAWASSGYAVQVKHLAPRLAQHCDLALLATYGLQGSRIDWQGIPVYPGGLDPFGNDVIKDAALDWRADVVLTLKDTFVFQPDKLQGVRWCPLVPVDHDPITPQISSVLRAAYRPIAYAPHGFRSLRTAGFDPLYAPHAYDPALISPQGQNDARNALGMDPTLFIVGMVAVNRGGVPSRKAWPQNLEAFALFAKDKPDARLFLHTAIANPQEGGIDIPYYVNRFGIADKVFYCDQQRYKVGFPDEYMNAFYNAIDVLNAVSLGEGFGVPTLEAQAAGTPVIVGDWCAQEDLCFGGWKVPKEYALRFPDQQLNDVYVPTPQGVAQAMHGAYGALKTKAAQHRDAAIVGAAPYAIDRVVTEHWLPLLDELAAQIGREAARGVLRIVRPEECGIEVAV